MEHDQSFNDRDFFDDMPLTDTVERLHAWHDRKTISFQWWEEMRKTKKWTAVFPKVAGNGFDASNEQQCRETLEKIGTYVSHLEQLPLRWKDWLHPEQIHALLQEVGSPGQIPFESGRLRSTLASDFEELRTLDRFLEEFTPGEKALLEALRGEVGSGEDFLDRLRNSIFQFWIEWLEEEQSVLVEVSSRMMDRQRVNYREKVHDRQEKVIQLIVRKLKSEITGNIEYNRLGNPVTYRSCTFSR